LLSQAILQARAYALALTQPAAPLAIVAAPAISSSAANSLISFISHFAPDVAVGILDREGFRNFVGPGLENSMPHFPAEHNGRNSLCESRRIYSLISTRGC
jgi:hypothetical protein